MTLVYVSKKNVGVKEPCRAHHDDEGIPNITAAAPSR